MSVVVSKVIVVVELKRSMATLVFVDLSCSCDGFNCFKVCFA